MLLSKFFPASSLRRWFVIILSLLAITSSIWLYQEVWASPASPPPTWHGITPGQTTIAEAQTILGFPDKQETRGGYQIHSYDHVNLYDLAQWYELELWLINQKVFAIYLSNPSDIPSVGYLVSQYGKPDKVTWTPYSEYRYLIWAQYGIIAEAWLDTSESERSYFEDSVAKMIFFEPTKWFRLRLEEPNWPWPLMEGIPWTRQDLMSEDPFDWENAPLPTAMP